MNRNTITQTQSLFNHLREIQIELEKIQAKFTWIEENWEGFPDTFPFDSSFLSESESDVTEKATSSNDDDGPWPF